MKYTHYVTHSNETLGEEVCDAYQVVELEKDVKHQILGTKLADHSYILRIMGHLLGKVLTTVEATTSNEKQAKAIKDLMRGHFFEEMEFVGSMMFDQEELNKAAEESLKDIPDEEITTVSVDEVLGIKEK